MHFKIKEADNKYRPLSKTLDFHFGVRGKYTVKVRKVQKNKNVSKIVSCKAIYSS